MICIGELIYTPSLFEASKGKTGNVYFFLPFFFCYCPCPLEEINDEV